MADLYGTNSKTPSPESEEMSSFLHNLLQSSSMASSPSFASFKPKHLPSSSSPPPPQPPPPPPPPPLPETSTSAVLWRSSSATFISDSDRVRGGASTDGSSVMIDSVSDFNFSDPGGFFPAGAKGSTSNTFSSAGVVVDSDAITSLMKNKKFPAENHFTDLSFSCERGLEASEVPGNQVPLPRSAKRTRAAEVHNLSEKRRRSRINEKLKALQNLIPNSNKTDKASMLDEAIEYLKQLQLQVQMLSMRNGLSLHPIYIPGSLQSLQLPETGVGFDEGNGLMNTNRTADTFCGNQEIPTLPAFDISNQCTPSNQPIVRPPTINSINPGTTFGLESLIQNQYGPITHLTASKEICREDTQSQLQIDTGKNSLSGMSS